MSAEEQKTYYVWPLMKWLDRRIAAPGSYITLCLNDIAFQKAMHNCGIKNPPNWILSQQSNASTHFLLSEKNELTSIVCLSDWQGRDVVEVAGLLVHEAVHIWQQYAEHIGEKNPEREQEAYAVQAIAQELLEEFRRRVARKKTVIKGAE